MTCFECGQGSLVSGVTDLVGERNGESFVVRMEGLKCDRCGFQTIDSGQSSEFTRLVSDGYREKHGLLKGSEIRARRSRLGMTQQRFSEYLGAGVASVKRWESGQIQDKAMDELIRLKTDPLAARENLRALEGQVPQKYVLSALVVEGKDIELTLNIGPYFESHPVMRMDSVFLAGDLIDNACGMAA